jgi:hypothetical protein
MAEPIADFPEKAKLRKRQSRYHHWIDGQVWLLRQGVDFQGAREAAANRFHFHAWYHNKRGITRCDRDDETVLYVQALPKP